MKRLLTTFAVSTLMACSGPQQYVPELCGDGIDNDENGKTDCADDWCKSEASCQVDHGSCPKCGEACARQLDCFATTIFNESLPLPLCKAGICEQLATTVRPKVTVNTSAFNGFGLSIRSGTTRFISKTAVNGSAVSCATLEAAASATVPDALDTDGGVNLLGLDVTRLDSWMGTVNYPLVSAQTHGPYLIWLEFWGGYPDSATKYPAGVRRGHSCFESEPKITTEILADYNCPSAISDAGVCHQYDLSINID